MEDAHPTAWLFAAKLTNTILLQSHSVPTSAQMRATFGDEVHGFFCPSCHRPFLNLTEAAVAWHAAMSGTSDGKNPATVVGAVVALPFRRSKGDCQPDAWDIPDRSCNPCYTAALRAQRRAKAGDAVGTPMADALVAAAPADKLIPRRPPPPPSLHPTAPGPPRILSHHKLLLFLPLISGGLSSVCGTLASGCSPPGVEHRRCLRLC